MNRKRNYIILRWIGVLLVLFINITQGFVWVVDIAYTPTIIIMGMGYGIMTIIALTTYIMMSIALCKFVKLIKSTGHTRDLNTTQLTI